LPFTLKKCTYLLKGKKKKYENSNTYLFHYAKKKNTLQKKTLCKKPKSFKKYYYNSRITNLKFQHKAQNLIFQNASYKNRPIIIIIIIIYIGAKIPLSYYYYYILYNNESKHNNILAFLVNKARPIKDTYITGSRYYKKNPIQETLKLFSSM
jgi:hypothetical protein